VFTECRLSFLVDFTERDGLEPARALKAKVEPADAGEQ
jgi:hypothetical protein